jgi:hypothetical protein
MTMHTVPKTVLDRSLRLARAPIDAALGVVGASDSAARHLVDRVEAGARSATGTLFADDELKQEGRDVLLATKQRERADRLHEEAELREDEAQRTIEAVAEETAKKRAEAEQRAEQERRKAEKRQRERESRATKSAAAEKEKKVKSAAKAKRTNTKRDQAAKLEKLDAKEESIEVKEEAARAQREAERLKEAAAAAKASRKDGNNGD